MQEDLSIMLASVKDVCLAKPTSKAGSESDRTIRAFNFHAEGAQDIDAPTRS